MIDLGKVEKNDVLYPSMAEKGKSKKYYPTVTLPLKLLGKKEVDLNDEITITLKGKVTRVEKSEHYNEFSLKATEGDLA